MSKATEEIAHCCSEMQREVEFHCDQHPGRWDCPDAIIHYDRVLDHHGIIVHDGGSSVISINFCPWCGHRLRNLLDAFIAELERLGLDELERSELPDEFRSGTWWKNRNL